MGQCFSSSLQRKPSSPLNETIPAKRPVSIRDKCKTSSIHKVASNNELRSEYVQESTCNHCKDQLPRERNLSFQLKPLRETENGFDATFSLQACFVGLRQVIDLLTVSDPADMSNVRRHLEVISNVLQTTLRSSDTGRKSIIPMDSGSKFVTPVPDEVREWLEMTFSHFPHSTPAVRPTHPRQRFKSVVNAIRIGIRVDRIHKEFTSSTYDEISRVVRKTLNSWTFNVFQVADLIPSHSLKLVAIEVLRYHDFMNKFKIPTSVMEIFLTRVENGYMKHQNSYHNSLHAADVMQTCHVLIRVSNLERHLKDLELFALLFAALVHDLEHTGTTNNFHINTRSDLAILYNDVSVLENHHVSSAFRLLKNPYANILQSLSTDEYREMRSLVIEMVLGTDMSHHFQQVKTLRDSLTLDSELETSKLLSYLLHCADISHPGKEWHSHKRWVYLLLEEFFKQGDKERELQLPYSPLCDRSNTLVAQSQMGFIDFIVQPSFQLLSDLLEKANDDLTDRRLKKHHPTSQAFPRHSASSCIRRANSDIDVRSTGLASSSSYGKLILPRPWEVCLVHNRQKWSKCQQEGDFTIGKDELAELNPESSITFKKRLLSLTSSHQ